jgi:heme oxygenase
MALKELTSELHSKAEKMEFNQRMVRGELSKKEYKHYLIQQAFIFQSIEEHKLADVGGMGRLEKIFDDIVELDKDTPDSLPIIEASIKYGTYLKGLDMEDLYPHIYLNYMALMFGGQIMKSKVPGKGRMYEFDNVPELIGRIRSVQTDEWADEVNKGFQYIIDILDELQTHS